MKKTSLIAALLAGAATVPAHGQVVYSNNFDSPAATFMGASASLSMGGASVVSSIAPYSGTYGNFLRNSTTGLTTLSLTGLGAHTSVSLGFVMAFLDSWDSTNGSPAPDYLNLTINSSLIDSYTANNASGSFSNYGGGSLIASGIQFDGNTFYNDRLVNMSGAPALTFAHSGSTLSISWNAAGGGWQGGTDEAWGIDNIEVKLGGVTTPVPEPETYALLLAGLGFLGFTARKRRKMQAD